MIKAQKRNNIPGQHRMKKILLLTFFVANVVAKGRMKKSPKQRPVVTDRGGKDTAEGQVPKYYLKENGSLNKHRINLAIVLSGKEEVGITDLVELEQRVREADSPKRRLASSCQGGVWQECTRICSPPGGFTFGRKESSIDYRQIAPTVGSSKFDEGFSPGLNFTLPPLGEGRGNRLCTAASNPDCYLDLEYGTVIQGDVTTGDRSHPWSIQATTTVTAGSPCP